MSDEPEELSIKPISLWPLRDATVNYFLGFFSFYFSQCFFQAKIWCNLTCFRDGKTRFVIPIYHIHTWNNYSLTTSCVSSWVPRQRTKTSPNLRSSDLVLCCWSSSVVCSESNLKWQHFPNKKRLLFFVVFKQHNRLKDGPEFLSFMLLVKNKSSFMFCQPCSEIYVSQVHCFSMIRYAWCLSPIALHSWKFIFLRLQQCLSLALHHTLCVCFEVQAKLYSFAL